MSLAVILSDILPQIILKIEEWIYLSKYSCFHLQPVLAILVVKSRLRRLSGPGEASPAATWGGRQPGRVARETWSDANMS